MEDLYYNILRFLSVRNIIRCSYVNKSVNNATKSILLWKTLFKQQFPRTKIFVTNYYESYKYCFKLHKLSYRTNYPGSIDYIHTGPQLDIFKRYMPAMYPIICKLVHLKNLFITYARLKTISPDIGQLINLEKLSFSNNMLTSLPSELGNLKKLHSLYISKNRIVSLPSELGDMNNLTHLYAGNNRIVIIPTEIANLKNLQSLFLDNNLIMVVPDEIQSMPNLKTLDIKNNRIKS
jgi:Leucine-rich repeat (LRR) protein